MSSQNSKLLVLAAVPVFIAMLASIGSANGETWTNLQGTNSIEAQFIGVWEDSVILQRSDGRRITVKLQSLQAASRIQARNLAKQGAAARAAQIAELKRQADSASAAAPAELPEPPPAPPYTPPQKDAAIGDFIKQVNDALTDGHLRVLFDFRPESYRKDISEIVKLAANKTSPESFQKVIAAPNRLGELIVTRQNWLFSSPRLTNVAADERDQAKAMLLGLGNVLFIGLSDDAIQLKALQTENFSDWLDSWDAKMAPYVAEMIEKSNLDLASLTTVESEGEGTATIATGFGESRTDVEMVLVDGYWVPKETSESWAKEVEQTKKQINESADGKYLETMATTFGMINTMLAPLERASRPDEYHWAFDAILSQPNSAEQLRQAIGTMLSPIQSIMSLSTSQADSGNSAGDDDQ